MSRFRRNPRATKVSVPVVESSLVTDLFGRIPSSLDEVEKEHELSEVACNVEVACYTVQNWGSKHENEDRIMTARGCHGGLSYHTIGVLDGHDTEAASETVSNMLPTQLSKHFKAGESVADAYKATMVDCESALKKTVQTAGTCVNSCTVAGRYIWCANLGDCRAALVTLEVPESASSPTKATSLCWLSKDHKASCPLEARRITQAKGKVVDGRVEGLEPSRTLGDFDVKYSTPPGVISIEPEVRCHVMSGTLPSQGLLIIASDGVWDVISGNDICDLIHARKELASVQVIMSRRPEGRVDIQPLRDLAQDLVEFAVGRGSRDDCTCVVALVSVTDSP